MLRRIAIDAATPMPRLLIADDNPLSLRFFADAAAQLGIDCALAENGSQALELARRDRFDLLLLDARMPMLGGPDVLARLRAESGPSRTAPAVATTADASVEARDGLLDAGFAEVIAKPVGIHDLHAAIARHLGIADAGSAPAGTAANALDDVLALAAAGGDPGIVDALRGLLMAELDALPAEIAAIGARADAEALRDRLHRLDASAGFCGTPQLVRAGAALRAALATTHDWPHMAISEFLAASAEVRALLSARRADAKRAG